jgi:hypothetical protein
MNEENSLEQEEASGFKLSEQFQINSFVSNLEEQL